MNISPARSAAFDILLRIETERAFSSVLLPQAENELGSADRGLCHAIVLGTLRRQIYLDRVTDALAAGKRLDAEVRIAIRMGLYQLVDLSRVPDHSAINESVELVARARKRSAKGFVNAILRSFTRKRPELAYVDDIDRTSVETSHPRWLIERWAASFGLERAGSLAAANNDIPRIGFRTTAPDLELSSKWRASEYALGGFVTENIDDGLRALHDDGRVYFQDEASQMTAAGVTVPPGGSFIDVCAAPGGKTGIVISRHADLRLAVAGDLHRSRTRLLRENLSRQGVAAVNIVQYDAAKGLPFPEQFFDAILVDAPCSGTGTIRSNPEIRYFLSPGDFAELSRKQHDILQNASKALKRGGNLVYSTCSVEREENEDVINEFLQESSDFAAVRPDVPGRLLTEEGFARTFPDRDGVDGFFVAKLVRS